MLAIVIPYIQTVEEKRYLPLNLIEQAQQIASDFDHVILSEGRNIINIQVNTDSETHEISVILDEENHLVFKQNGKRTELNVPILVALYEIERIYAKRSLTDGKKYTREGMQKRVWRERQDKADKATYRVSLNKNLYGEHTLTNEKGEKFRITLHDFDKKTGYIDNIDWHTNKLGTTKHILYLYNYFEQNPQILSKFEQEFPFIEIYTDPTNDYKISWFFPDKLSFEEKELIQEYFGDNHFIELDEIEDFFGFIPRANEMDRFKIRPEVLHKIENYFEKRELEQLSKEIELDYSLVNADLYPFQEEGVRFAVFKKGVIIADEMGLGKTLQAISTAILKKDLFDFKKTLVICPASVKHQWRKEVERFTDENAIVVEGFPEERAELYINDNSFFHIINYETVLRDIHAINQSNYDFVILDEAQKIKNYETKTSNAVKQIKKKHALVITGTPLENKILDLYSIVNFLDPHVLAPQWEFSYQHCVFDEGENNRILGYYDLQKLKTRLDPILIRRQKKEVFDQLPQVIQKDVVVNMTAAQADYHAGFMRGIAHILAKKFKTAYDMQRLMLLMSNARMVSDSTFLIDKETHHSSKMDELNDILFDKLDIQHNQRKIIIFSEWVTMLNIIGEMLKEKGVTFTTLTGKVPVKKRKDLIENFEKDANCKVFLSTESGGAGLNLQMADTVINFELPWNPAKKNQRIGRIDRIGQKKDTLLVYNLICNNSIEVSINAGLGLKQNLFNSIMNANSMTDVVDFSEKGKSQFIEKLEEAVQENLAQLEAEKNQQFTQTELSFEENDDEMQLETAEGLENSENPDYVENTSPQNKTDDKATEEKHPQNIPKDVPEALDPQTLNENQQVDHQEEQFAEMEAVMNKGVEFLSGIYKMSTGKDMTTDGKPAVKVDKTTGEVSITFKLN